MMESCCVIGDEYSLVMAGNASDSKTVDPCASSPAAVFEPGSFIGRIGRSPILNHITCITIPNTVTHLDQGCFDKHKCLRRVTFECHSRLQEIPKCAFRECQLQDVEIPSSVKILGPGCFYSCSKLERLVFESHSSLVKLDFLAFAECSSLIGVVIPATVEVIGDESFQNCVALGYAHFESGSHLKEIGEGAFKETALTEFNVPASVERLGNSCFNDCSMLYEVNFEEGSVVKEIGDEAFMNCASLSKINLPATLERIGGAAFLRDGYIPSIAFLKNLTLKKLEHSVFYRCTDVRDVTIPACIEVLGRACLYRCSLERVDFEPGSCLKIIESHVFDHCEFLTEITIPSSVEVIRNNCFSNCVRLQSVTFEAPSCVKAIGKRSFSWCTQLINITIPASVEDIRDSCFTKCEKLARVLFEDGSNLRKIRKQAFKECVALEAIVIPSTVKSIGEESFAECYSLATVEFQSGSCLKKLHTNAFTGCCISEICVPGSVENMMDLCFSECEKLAKVSFEGESHLKCIRSRVFSHCSSLHEFRIPASVEQIGGRAFYNSGITDLSIDDRNPYIRICDNMVTDIHGEQLISVIQYVDSPTESFEVPANIRMLVRYSMGVHFSHFLANSTNMATFGAEYITFQPGSCLVNIDNNTFTCNTTIKEITIPATAEVIGSACFNGCINLQRVVIEDGSQLRSIKCFAFATCKSLREFRVPSSVEYIGMNCFEACDSLECVEFDEGVAIRCLRKGIFSSCSKLKTIRIPKSVELIGTQCFALSNSLESVTFEPGSRLKKLAPMAFAISGILEICIPAGVENIPEECFKDCPKLKRVTFEEGSSLKSIDERAFSECSGLREIELPSTVESIRMETFTDCDIDIFCRNGYESHGGVLVNTSNDSIVHVSNNCKNLEVPANIRAISASLNGVEQITFENGSRLTQIKKFAGMMIREICIPANVETLCEFCFNSCERLERVSFEKGSRLRRIETCAFDQCMSLTEVEIPATVEEIDGLGHCNVRNLTIAAENQYYKVSDGMITDISGEVFVTSFRHTAIIKIPATIRVIGKNCFRNREGLDSVEYEDMPSLKCIESGAFYNTDGLEAILIPASVEEIKEDAFGSNPECSFIFRRKNVRLSYIGFRPNCNIGVLSTGVFHDSQLTKFHVPASVEVISKFAFGNCNKLAIVTFENGSRLKRIEKYAFKCCYGLESMEIPASVEDIEAMAFFGCNIRGFSISEENPHYRLAGCMIIDASERVVALCKNTGSTIEIPASIQVINKNSFRNPTSSLKSVRFAPGSQLKRIESRAFYGMLKKCKGLELPASVEHIGCGAFSACKIENITIPDENMHFRAIDGGIVDIRDGSLITFFRTTEDIQIPACVEVIGKYCIANRSVAISYIAVEEHSSLKRIERKAFIIDAEAQFALPESLEVISARCVSGDTHTFVIEENARHPRLLLTDLHQEIPGLEVTDL